MNIIKKVFYRLQFLSHSERKLKPATNNENALAEKLRNDMTIVSNNSNSSDFWYDTHLSSFLLHHNTTYKSPLIIHYIPHWLFFK